MGRIAFAIGGLTVLASLPAASTSDAVDPALDPPRVTSATASAGLIQISQMGAVASDPAIAYNPDRNEFLVVWIASGDIYGQRIDATTGAEVGANDFRIGETTQSSEVSVVYNDVLDEYYVVWQAGSALMRNTFAQRLTGTGQDIGNDSIAVDNGGPQWFACDGRYPILVYDRFQTYRPSLTYDSVTGAHLIPHHHSYPYCIHPFISSAAIFGVPGGTAYDTRVSLNGSIRGLSIPLNERTSAAYNSLTSEFLVVSETGRGALLAADASHKAATGPGSCANGGLRSLVHNANANEYFVACDGGADAQSAFEVSGRRLSSDGTPIGPLIPIARQVPGTSSGGSAVALSTFDNEYLVTWYSSAGHVKARRVAADGTPIGTAPSVLLNTQLSGQRAAPAHAAASRRYLVVTPAASPDGRREIIGRFYALPAGFVVGPGAAGGGQLQSWNAAAPAYQRQAMAQLPWPTYNALNGELHPAMGDVDGDGLDETVVGLARGGDGWIAIFDDAQHGRALLTWIRLPWPSYNASNGTIWPAVGDIDGDGKAEVVAGVGAGGGGWYAIFDDASQNYAFLTWRRVSWPWYSDTQSGETRPAVANIDGGSFSEIVIGLGAGGGGWMELVDDAAAGYAHLRWLRVGWSDYSNGPGETYPAAGDTDGDGYDEIVVGLGANSLGWVEVFDDAFAGLVHKAWLQVNWPDYATASGETHPAVGDVDGDADAEIVLGLGTYTGQGGWFEIRDGSTNSFASLGWFNLGDTQIYYRGVATFPAASMRRQ